ACPARRLGLGSVAHAAGAPRLREADRGNGPEVRAGQGAPPAPLVGLPHRSGALRVLARPAVPVARPVGVRQGRGRLDHPAALSLTDEEAEVAAFLRGRSEREEIETSCARIFLRGDEALKIKRRVDLGFLDFTTLEKRRWAIE